MNFDYIEGLTNEQIDELYDDETKISDYWCGCCNGRVKEDCRTYIQEKCYMPVYDSNYGYVTGCGVSVFCQKDKQNNCENGEWWCDRYCREGFGYRFGI